MARRITERRPTATDEFKYNAGLLEDRDMKRAMASALMILVASAVMAQTPEGDQHWNARAEGSQNGHAKPDHVNAAIAAYQRAIAQDPNDLEPRWKLLRALRFKGAYVASTNEEKKQIYAQAKKAGEEALT